MKNLAQKLKRRFTNGTQSSNNSTRGNKSYNTNNINNGSDGTNENNMNNSNNNSNNINNNGNNNSNTNTNNGNSNIEIDDNFETDKIYSRDDLLDPVPSFREVTPEKRKNLFIKKLRLCAVTFDFQNESAKENMGKEMKRQILLELVDHITTNKGWFNELILLEILNMISCNLFRAFGPTTSPQFDPDEDEPVLDPAWPHLQIVYEFLLRFIVSSEPDPKLLKKQMNGNFILNLLNIFKSEDPREREYLKTILHRIYGKFMSLRSYVRRAINDVFYCVIYENEKHNGIGELLEILGSIINGFAMPLKLEHKKFLRNILIPLHKVNKLSIFHQQLSYCATQFIDKDNTLSIVVIGGLLKYWPITSSSKEVLLLNELEEILELTPNNLIKPFLIPIFNRLSKCIENQHFQVAERALFFWNNDLISTLTAQNKHIIFPIIVPILHNITNNHWNTTVHSLTLNVTRMLIEIDNQLYNNCIQSYQLKDNPKIIKEQRNHKWETLKILAKSK